ncbi:DNA-protecting protein DprA [bacterium]|nr:DNA-protecting protein DprA [bacterium]
MFPAEESTVDASAGPVVRREPSADLISHLRLSLVPGIGPRHLTSLLDYFGGPDEVLAASLAELEHVSGIGPKLARLIQTARHSKAAENEWRLACEHGFRFLERGTPVFPTNLDQVPDAPRLLRCRGEVLKRDDMAVAIVGARRCTVYGQQQAERLGRALAMAGLTIVSGLARGIDGAAHRGALAAGGRTIAVSATGLLEVYPPEHKDLAAQIAESGAILSENRLEQKPNAGLFPQRNRIISGISLGVIIVEANRKSGALHTARHANEQGREVMALPGRVDSLASEGCHDLIRDGATLIRDADDVLHALGPLIEPVTSEETGEVRSTRELTLNDQERAVLNCVQTDPRLVDEVIRDAGIEPSRVLATLTVLEMKRLVRRLPGSMIMRAGY